MPQGRIDVNPEQCKGCGLCCRVCPFGLIELGSKRNSQGYCTAVLHDPEQRCTGCTLCAMICPDAAISVFRISKVGAVAG